MVFFLLSGGFLFSSEWEGKSKKEVGFDISSLAGRSSWSFGQSVG